MRTEQVQTKKGSKDSLLGALGCLALAAGAILSMGGTSAKRAASPNEVAKPAAAAVSSAATDGIEPGEANADKDAIELQLD